MYYVHAASGERFYLRLLLTTIPGATSFDFLKTVGDHLCITFKEACVRRGLLEDDGEWRQCLEEAAHMATGQQLRSLFVIILKDCLPTDPRALWLEFRDSICDDLRRRMERHPHNMVNPSQDEVYDFGLYLIDRLLCQSGKALKDWPDMPQPTADWMALLGNPLLLEQRTYDQAEQHQLAEGRIPTLNAEQRAVFDAVVQSIDSNSGQSFFLHGPGGTGKTYVYNTLCYYLRGQGKVVICVASSGIAALLLMGGRTSHSMFRIPIEIHESSMCSFKRNSDLGELIREASLIIWDEAPMQHRHIHEAVDRTFRDARNCEDKPFGGLPIVFGGDFQQILPVIPRGSRPQIVDACMQRSFLWTELRVMYLKRSMRLNTEILEERQFAEWQLQIGRGGHTNLDTGDITLPESFRCGNNTIDDLISTIYPGLNPDDPLPGDQYFSERTILSSRNDDVDFINSKILRQLPGESQTFTSVDAAGSRGENGGREMMYPREYLNSINCSGLPLARLELKIGAPVMVLRNLAAAEGVCNGTRGVVAQMSARVIRVRLLTGTHAGDTVFIPRLKITPSESQVPFDFSRIQFPIRLSFAMTINKSQGQSVAHVGLDLRSPVFTHGQLYVAISRVTSVQNIKAVTTPKPDGSTDGPLLTKNIVYPEVLRALQI